MIAVVNNYAFLINDSVNLANEIDVHAAAVPLPDDVAAGVAGCNTRSDQARFHIRLRGCA